MSTADLEAELDRHRLPDEPARPSNARRLTIREALAYRAAGNIPDEMDRTLRLVLMIERDGDLTSIDATRRLYEPDYHERPSWRAEGSAPVNVVPLRSPGVRGKTDTAWWNEPALAALEAEWKEHGTIAGLEVPADYRGFVFKTVVALRAAGLAVTAASVADSIERWVEPSQADEIRSALEGSDG